MDVFQLWGKIAIDNAQANSAIDGTTDKAEQSSNSMGKAFQKIGSAVAAYFAADKIIDFGKACVSAAAEVSAEVSAFEQIMGDYADEASGKVEKIAEATGMVDSRLTPYMTSLTAKFKGLGYDIGDATDMATTGLTIAADAAAFWDKSLDDAMGSLNSFVNGSYEGGEAIGLFANESTLATWAAQNLNLEWADLTEKEKQFARLEFAKAMQKASGATGQAAKESSQYANVQANLNEKWRQFKAEIGEPILQNLVIPGMQTLSDVVDFASKNLDDITIVVLTLAGAMAGKLAGQAIVSVVAGFQTAQVQLALYAASAGAASISQGVLNGQFTIGEVVVGVLTGKISLATAAQWGWNAAMNANPIGLLITLCGGLAIAIKKAYDAGDKYMAELVGEADTIEGLTAKYNELNIEIGELEDIQGEVGFLTDDQMKRLMALEQALGTVEEKIASLRAEEEAAAAAAETPAAKFKAATEEYSTAATELMNKFQDSYESILGNVEGWFQPFAKASVDVTTSIKEIMDGMKSQINFNNQYAENLQYLADVGLGNLSEAFQAYGAEGAAYAAAMATAIQEAGGTATREGTLMIQNLQTQAGELETSQGDLANTMALMNGEFESQMQALTNTYAEKVKDLDKSGEALEAAQNTMNGLLSGINSGTPKILSAMSQLGSQMTSRLQASLGTVYIDAKLRLNSTGIPGHEDGLDRVPYDNYLAYLHKDEAVLTASEARAWRAGKAAATSPGTASSEDNGSKRTGQGVTVIQYIQAIAQTPVELAAATEAYFAQARWAT